MQIIDKFIKIISSLGALAISVYLIRYFYVALSSSAHPARQISTAVLLLVAEFFMMGVVTARSAPNFKRFPVIMIAIFYGIFALLVYTFYRDRRGVLLALANFIFLVTSALSSPLSRGESNKYIINRVYLLMLTIFPVALGSTFIVKALPFLKAQFPPSSLVNGSHTELINLSEATLVWAVLYFSLTAIVDTVSAFKVVVTKRSTPSSATS